MLRVDSEARHTKAISDRENQQQPQKAGDDSRKPHGVKLPAAHGAQTSPALQRPRGDQKSGDHEEDSDSVVSVPEQDPICGRSDHLSEGALVEVNAKVDVMNYDRKDAESAQNVDT